MWNVDLSKVGSDSDSDPKPSGQDGSGDGWGYDDPSWEDLPDPEVEAQKKREEEERIARQKQQAAEAEAKRKADKKALAIARKAQRLKIEEEGWDDGDDFMSAETAQEQARRSDFRLAQDVMGSLTDSVDSAEIDIGRYIPATVGEFNSYKDAIVTKVNSLALKDPVKLIQHIITALADDYQSKFLKELAYFCADLYNKKIGKEPRSVKTGGKAFLQEGSVLDLAPV
jgi:hypothetical protein